MLIVQGKQFRHLSTWKPVDGNVWLTDCGCEDGLQDAFLSSCVRMPHISVLFSAGCSGSLCWCVCFMSANPCLLRLQQAGQHASRRCRSSCQLCGCWLKRSRSPCCRWAFQLSTLFVSITDIWHAALAFTLNMITCILIRRVLSCSHTEWHTHTHSTVTVLFVSVPTHYSQHRKSTIT